ncbi:DEAD/DEAH box helicase [Thioalkalivibrio sp. HK1]|uniref:DEAD/DEAH box helicase n=1 Tax=Thioalkalivibrio sp. HK1 TaxID=1469245 RepID=UPI00047149E6|nr:DEAD/DEAH box helicase [Thioalkalivibrio sp. HK1]
MSSSAEEFVKDAAFGADRLGEISTEASRRRLFAALSSATQKLDDREIRFVTNALELELFDALDDEERTLELRDIAGKTFQIARTLAWPQEPVAAAQWLVRLGCLAVIGDRSADFRRIVTERPFPVLPLDSPDWGIRVWSSVLDVWLHLLRKQGWDDLDIVQERVVALRRAQQSVEPAFLQAAEDRQDVQPAWELMAQYHLAKAADLLGTYLGQGSIDGHYDIREQLEAQFDRAIGASARGRLIELEVMSRRLARVSRLMVDNSIWTVTRAVNSRVTRFVESLMDRDSARRPIFEMLPPQRRTLREEGLLGSGHRSVVVSLPTSSGKTFIAEFRILQALNQFDQEKGWIAYLAPTRALVNQLTVRLRRDFSHLGTVVEKVSPALEVDGLEAGMLTEADSAQQFRILVTTPEKLDLMLRGGWEERIGRPLTLVVVDEAHGLASDDRGIKLELLLATINRECRYAQFLLLTPFIPNGAEIARWLSPDSNKSIDLGVDWTPNDRVVAIARAERGDSKGDFSISLLSRHTSRNTLDIPERIDFQEKRPLGLAWSEVNGSQGKIAAATAQILQKRGTVIVLADTPASTWRIADTFRVDENRRALDGDLRHVQQFLIDEMGQDFPLADLLEYGIGVHHAGMSEDARTLVEWLTETGRLGVLVATTTIAQGVNFPVSGIVFASHQYRTRKFPFRIDMPPQDFWNIAGRAGRVDQEDLGVIALAAQDDNKQQALGQFIDSSVAELNSTLIEMVQSVADKGSLLRLESLSYQPGWSAFVQYLAHTYRQIGNHEQFAEQVEQVLRGTLGFQALRKSHEGWADALVQGVYAYAERIKGKPLALVDATGFSWESVSNTLARIGQEQLPDDVWSPELFAGRKDDLRRMMGLLLQVPELREPLRDVTGGKSPNGDMLARIICDWVQGRPLTEMATDYFQPDEKEGSDAEANSVDAITKCCRNVFGRLTQTASWGLSALQSLMLKDDFDEMSAVEQRSLRNLPARVYYGVNTDEAVALRLLGVPRIAAPKLARHLGVTAEEPLHRVRGRLRATNVSEWTKAMGERGASYHRVWSIIEGQA